MLVLAKRQHISNAAGPGEGRYERIGDDGWPKSRSWSLVWVIRDRCSRSCLPVYVRFGPKATYIRRCREMTRCAIRVILQRRKTASLFAAGHNAQTCQPRRDTVLKLRRP
jgi:hypothetical protein